MSKHAPFLSLGILALTICTVACEFKHPAAEQTSQALTGDQKLVAEVNGVDLPFVAAALEKNDLMLTVRLPATDKASLAQAGLVAPAKKSFTILLFGLNWYRTQTKKPALPTPETAAEPAVPSPLADKGLPPQPAAPAVPKGALYAQFFARPRGIVEFDGTEPILGDPEAPYIVLEWADFGCPHCAIAAEELHELVEQRPDVQVRFRVFPLTSQCNGGVLSDRGPERCLAAVAAECAHQQSQAWEYMHLMFQGHRLSMPDLDRYANTLGLDPTKFASCMVDPRSTTGVTDDVVAGVDAGIDGTPSIFLKGTHGEDWVAITWGVDALRQVIAAHAAGIELPAPGAMPEPEY